jgi:hypothetical protein
VHGDHPVEVFDRKVDEPLLLQEPGVVHQDLGRTVSLVRRLHDTLYGLRIGDVAWRGRRLSPRLLYPGDDLVGGLTFQVVDDHSLAVLRELLGNGAADPASRPCNQDRSGAFRGHRRPPSIG